MRHRVDTVRTEGLGDSTYVFSCEGLAVVVDPQRDIDRFETVLNETGAELRFVLETHLHNDYVSGGRNLATKLGGELVMPAGAAPAFRHRPAFHHEDIDMGDWTIRPIHTPGHTPEHVSYLIVIDGRDVAVFSGGSLLVGSAGRSDLLGEARAETLARLQYGSVKRLAELSDEVGLFPTHGAGSFCAATSASAASSTIGIEKKTSPVLSYEDEDSFVKGQLNGLSAYPSYYSHMGQLNITGLPDPDLQAKTLTDVPANVTVIDARPRAEFAAGHMPGSIGIELGDSFGVWVGWIIEQNTPLAIVLDETQDAGEAMRQLARIGRDEVVGILRPIAESFTANHQTVSMSDFADAAAGGACVLDVRAPDEWEEGTIPGSTLCYLPDLVADTPSGLSHSGEVWVVCGSGYRANIASGILQQRGLDPVVLVDGGVPEILARLGQP